MSGPSRYHEADYASEYDTDRFGGSFGAVLERQEIALYRRLLAGSEGPVLDAGCGTGKLSVPLLAAGRPVVSADFSPEMLTQARDKARRQGQALRPVLADIQGLAFADRSFPTVISSRALMHVPDWRRGLAELCRVCSDLLVLDVPPTWSSSGLDAVRRRLQEALPGAPGHPYRTFSARQVVAELARQGFAVEERERTWVLPVVLHRALDRPRLSRGLEAGLAGLGLRRLLGAPLTLKARRRS